jgi:hypothetical protein
LALEVQYVVATHFTKMLVKDYPSTTHVAKGNADPFYCSTGGWVGTRLRRGSSGPFAS